MDDKSFTVRVPKRWVRIAMIVGVTALIVAPLTAIASHSFTDVPDSNTFHEDIAWLADADVTKGCNPPANTQFCPDDEVTRGQMAAFLRRLAENQVVDAATAVTAETATNAEAAANADTLDGLDSSDFVGTEGGLSVWAALYATGTSIQNQIGVASITEESTGVYLVDFDRDVPEFPVVNVTGVNIGGNTCNWSFAGPISDAIRIRCYTPAGAAAAASFSLVVHEFTDASAESATQPSPEEGG
jgi:hypothetical protein